MSHHRNVYHIKGTSHRTKRPLIELNGFKNVRSLALFGKTIHPLVGQDLLLAKLAR